MDTRVKGDNIDVIIVDQKYNTGFMILKHDSD